MALVLKNRVRVTATTTGTGTFTLGSAVTGYQDFSVVGNANTTYYLINDATNWEAGIGTFTTSGTTLSRDQVLESSNSNALVDWAAGTKTVICGFPSNATPGGVPFCDANDIGTDLSGWEAFKTALNAGVVGGQTYNNGGVAGIVSTYSLVYTASNSYIGGVLAPNGDIHFVPTNANRGQKISAAGVVSTYSLVYIVSQAYIGGVLAPNGDIHFVPWAADQGQQISTCPAIPLPSDVCLSSYLNKF